MTDLTLAWQPYRMFDYERDLALREVSTLLRPTSIAVTDTGVEAMGCRNPERARDLVYFSEYRSTKCEAPERTRQSLVEGATSGGRRRQPTRYASHGLHDYKGKFNPQTAQVLLNLSEVKSQEVVLDPYCGSGTTLAEASLRGVSSVGVDINPLALMISKTKAAAIGLDANQLRLYAGDAIHSAKKSRRRMDIDDRTGYLQKWFPPDTLSFLERFRLASETCPAAFRHVLQLLASDLLREYSLQDPQDLRVRRRKSPLPEVPIADALDDAVAALSVQLENTQAARSGKLGSVSVVRGNIAGVETDRSALKERRIGVVVTSPPYAMALPYIETQRLSIVWLGLARPSGVRKLESELTGSREVGTGARRELEWQLLENKNNLPASEAALCADMLNALAHSDGFRRRAVPALLYRYFMQMGAMFRNVRALVDSNVPYYLVVGHNKTTLGGTVFNIDTPAHLASLASASGWAVDEVVPLQAYQRYGLHARNGVDAESLVMLRSA